MLFLATIKSISLMIYNIASVLRRKKTEEFVGDAYQQRYQLTNGCRH